MNTERPTPETDDAFDQLRYADPDHGISLPENVAFGMRDLARNLERQRDGVREQCDDYHRKACEIADHRDRLISQRDELLEALTALVEMPDDRLTCEFTTAELEVWRAAGAAIAKVKGTDK